jgi:hypothetical protein
MNEIAAMHGVTGALAVLLAFQNLFEDQIKGTSSRPAWAACDAV